jgi:hypothetical protein
MRDLKTKVVTVAKREAKTHNWCSVVDRALVEVGLGPQWETVAVEMTVPLSMNLDVDKNIYENLDPEWVQTTLQTALDSLPRQGVEGGVRFRGSQKVQVGTPEITKFEKAEQQAPVVLGTHDVVPPPGYEARYTSHEGRVLHYVQVRNERATANYNRLQRSALCNGSNATSYYWSETSNRAEGRVCAECQRRAARAA